MIRFNMPKLRIYQQILICFGLIVSLPLLGVTFIINDINQKAMKKDLARFTEHTAEALYRDFETEMSWQKQQGLMLATLMNEELRITNKLPAKNNFEATASRILRMDPNMDAIGLYDANGHLVKSRYRNFESLSPELRLQSDLPVHPPQGDASTPDTNADANKETLQPFQVIFYNSGNPQDSPYYLRAVIPVTKGQLEPLWDAAAHRTLSQHPDYYYVQQKNFGYLQKLVHSNNSLYGAFYIIDSDGLIIAGPEGADLQERIREEDYKQFRKIRPGVTHEFSSTSLAAQSGPSQNATPKKSGSEKSGKDSEETPALKKVIVKMPDINWGIIIESPYHVKQRYIKKAGTQTFLLVLASLGIMLLMVLPYILGISRNFRQLIKGVKAMGEGNYYRRIRLITNFFTPYEIVYLTLEFNRMARKTADSWSTIQEANRKLALLDEFKSNLIDTVSHELRTPLTSIKGYTSRLLRYDSSLDAETRVKSLKVVKQQADRLGRLVEDLLVIPDLETAGLRVYPDQVALAPMLDNCVQFIQAKEQRDITVHIAPDMQDSLDVLADPDRLEQILLNLLDNAVKYSLPDTDIDLSIEKDITEAETPSARESQPEMIRITVSNQCDPIPMENLESLDSLFEKFKRLDDSLVRTTRGSGLGLFITRGLVEAMGGEIALHYDEPGRFRVSFTVPAYQESAVDAPVAWH
jgi:signal transduction histidine kinase